MKKSLSFLICICLLIGICAAAYAETDVSKIRPDGIVPVYENSGYVLIYTMPDGTVVIIPDYHGPIYQETNTNNNNTDNTTTEDKQDEQKEEEKQEEKEQETEDKKEDEKKDDEGIKDDPEKMAAFIEEIFKLINEERATAGVEALNYNMELQHPADIRAVESVAKFAHTRPDGTSCFTVVKDLDYTCVGENLIKADNAIATARRLVNSWMQSEGHRANILNPDFTETAIGVFVTDDMTYSAELFMG